MGKQLKKIAKYSMAAALASSALVPSAVALAADEKEVATDISFVVVKNEQGLIKLDLEAYNAALAFDEIKDTDVQYVVADNGDIFTLDAYNAELAFADSPAEALKTLTENNTAKDIVVKDGKISEDGKAVAEDETPSTELKVESVSAINNNGVTVTFPALTGDITGASVEVKDPAGNTVAVVAQNLAKGATTATFPFTAAQSSLAAGTWTVDGKEILVKSQDAGLQNLVSNVGIWSEDFAKNKLANSTYSINVENSVSSIQLTPTAAEGATITAQIMGAGLTPKNIVVENNKVNTIDLAAATTADSTTTVVFTVIAPDGKTSKTYSVNIERPAANASNDAYATNIKVGTTAVDNFNSKVFTYGANVTSGISSQNIEVTADKDAKVYVNGVAATNVAGTFTSEPVQFQPGKNTVEVKVVAQDGQTSQTYTVEVTRAVVGGSADVKLNSVTLSAGTLSGFNPTLATAQTLTTFVPNEVKELTVTPVGNHANATIVVTSTGTNTDLKVEKQGTSYVVKNLTDSTTLTNEITIKVVAEDGTTTVSNTLEITRATATASDVANLTALNIQGVVNNFVSTTTEYAGKVANATGTVGTITATAPTGSFVTYEVNGINYGTDLTGSSTTAKTAAEAAVLKLGANTVKITVTSANAKNSRTYTVNLERADVGSSSVKTLNTITATTGTITGFTADAVAPAGGLKVNVPNATTEFTFKPTATHAKATVSVTAAKGSTNAAISASAATTDKLEVVKNADGSFTVKGLQTLSTTSNVAVITVTAEDASTAIYNLQIDRAVVSASDNALLTSFDHGPTTAASTTGVTFTGTTASITIPPAENVVYIKPTPVDSNATVLVDGKPLDTTGVSAPISVAVGETKAVAVKVTAANGSTVKEYTINVKRAVENASTDNTLSGLTLSAGLLNGFVASTQVVDSAVALDTTVSAATENLTITPTAKNAGATVSVVASTGTTYDADKALTVEKSGDAYTVKGLVGGSTANTVVITVTSASGAPKVYTLKVTRAIDGVSTDSALADAGLTVTPSTAGVAGTAIDATTATSPFDFKGATKEYTVYTENGVDKVNFTATEKVEGQTFTAKVNGQAVPVAFTNTVSLDGATIAAELVRGQNNKVEITVTAPDAATSTTYTVNVVSAASGASSVATLQATPFTNVSPNVTISSTATDTYSTATLDGNIATFKFKPAFTNAQSRAVVSITTGGTTKFYTPDANGVYTVDVAATGTTAVNVTVVAGDNTTSKDYTLNLVKTP